MRMTRLTIICISFIVISLMLTGISSAKIDPKTAAGIWLFDEGNGDVTKDFSGNGNDGKLDGPTWVKGKFGNALEFDAGKFVDCGDDESLSLGDSELTIGAWIKQGERPVIQPGELGKEPPGHGVLLQAQEGYQKPIGWITIEGLEIRYGWDGVKLYNAHDIVIRNCNIHDNYNQGILGNGNRVLIDGNIIAGNGTNENAARNLMHGIYSTGTAFTITNNIIHSNTAYGIQVAAYDYNKDSMAGPEYADAKNWLIANNTLAFNKHRAGMVIWMVGVENCTVQNNIFYKNGGVNGILFYNQQGQRHLIRNNIFYPPGENLVSSEEDAYQAIDNLELDPLFADARAFDFHLKADSPAINVGVEERAPMTDFEGKRRPQGGRVDIGACEFNPDSHIHAPSKWANGNKENQMLKPLTVHPANPRYFTDSSGKAIYLTGSHTWANLQDIGLTDPPPIFNWAAYLDFMRKYNHNFMRMWAWEQAAWAPWTSEEYFIHPLPYMRTGLGTALDGKPKFNLDQFNQRYFDRLRSRVIEAGNRGIYVGIMLFEGWSNMKMDLGGRKKHLPGNPWRGHPFNKENNINGIDGDANGNREGEEVHTLSIPTVTRRQEAYVRKVIDTVNDLDNVLYEIGNEAPIETKEWQYHIVHYIQSYESTKQKQHPVGMTAFYAGREGAVDALLASPADWISPQTEGGVYRYDTDPPSADGQKVIIVDTDHIFGVGGDGKWVWKSFLRGLNPIYMDPFEEGQNVVDEERLKEPAQLSKYDSARRAMGDTLNYANKMNLAKMVPQNTLSSTGYCLAAPGSEYLIYQPEDGIFTVNLQGFSEKVFSVEWFNPETGFVSSRINSTGNKEATSGTSVTGGADITFNPPFGGSAVLYLKK